MNKRDAIGASAGELRYLIFYVGVILVKYFLGALLFIWAVNTLFNFGILFSWKTCLAGIVLLWVSRLFLRGLEFPFREPEHEDYFELNKLTGQQLFDIAMNKGRKNKS